jgi:hypothetical protein
MRLLLGFGREKMMNLAYLEQRDVFKEYKYNFNQGGELDIKLSNGSNRQFTITLKNGKCFNIKHNLDSDTKNWGRSEWVAVAAIGQQIIELEKQAKIPSNGVGNKPTVPQVRA